MGIWGTLLGVVLIGFGAIQAVPSARARAQAVYKRLLWHHEQSNQGSPQLLYGKLGGGLLSLVGAVLTLGGLVGPLWPTELMFDPSSLYQKDSFGMPIQIANKSLLFGITVEGGNCHVSSSSFALKDFGGDFASVENNFDLKGKVRAGNIGPGEEKSFMCDAIKSQLQPTYYQMKVDIRYHYKILPIFTRTLSSDDLVWDMGRFYVGGKLN